MTPAPSIHPAPALIRAGGPPLLPAPTGASSARAATDHFTLLGVLGSGSMGVVYRAYDRWLGRDVAVKILRHGVGVDLYRFKREFRALADIVHPNLVVLHEMQARGDEWMVAMELIEGVSFIDWVRHWPRADSSTDARVIPGAPPPAPRSRQSILRAPLDFARLDHALPQLVEGILALHVYGKLHRDLKPSNVLVTPEGRVVLLDFGLVSDLHASLADQTHFQAAVGTPIYMSPEQATDAPLTEASDWYALGAMLYEALTGRRPFEGTRDDVLHEKLASMPPRPRTLAPFVPPELDELCSQLLARAPTERPDGRTILSVLGRAPLPATVRLERAATPRPVRGRAAEMAALRRALHDASQRPVAVLVRGDSGIGKSRLARAFLDEIRDDAVVLEGRCYLRESVPFRALDGVVDAMASAILRLSPAPADQGLPAEIDTLARVFPVLQRVPAIAERSAAAMAMPAPPAQELRRRVLVAMRAVCAWLARQRPLVIAVDDFQWGDADSALVLADLLHRAEALPLLMVLVHRTADDAGAIPLIEASPGDLPGADVRTIEVGPLGDDDARAVAGAIVGGHRLDDVVREGRGHPLFLVELAYAAADDDTSRASLEDMIGGRVRELPPQAAALLHATAVAARPLPLIEAARIAGLAGVGTELSLLLAARLVRLVCPNADDVRCIEPFHDRVRAAVVAALDPTELRRIHDALTRAYEGGGLPRDLDALAAHCLGAGDPARAARYAAQAAEVADAALAFHRAAELYALALAIGTGDAGERRRLQRRRGTALANAGRLDEAAAAFAEASLGADDDELRELEQLRVEQLVRRGRLGEGMALARRLLARIGVSLPSGRAALLRELSRRRAALHHRGHEFTERPASQIAPRELRHVDLLGSLAMGLSVADPVIGPLTQCHFLQAALDLGEPRRVCIALTTELGYLSEHGSHARGAIEALATEVRALATRVHDPYVTGLVTTMEGLVAFEVGAWKRARALFEAGIPSLCEHASGPRWEIDVAELFHLGSLFYLGETRELVCQVPRLLRDATDRGDLFAQHALRAWRPNLAWLVMDRPDDARAHVVAVDAERPAADAFHLRDYYQLSAHAHIDLYLGDAAAAWQRIEQAWPGLLDADVLRIQTVRVEAAFLRARSLIARLATVPVDERRPLVEEARDVARGLGREHATWASGFSMQILAMADAAEGARRQALEWLDGAQAAFEAADMGLHASVARLRKGELAGGARGDAQVVAARRAMTEQAIVDVDAIARMLCPWPARVTSG